MFEVKQKNIKQQKTDIMLLTPFLLLKLYMYVRIGQHKLTQVVIKDQSFSSQLVVWFIEPMMYNNINKNEEEKHKKMKFQE